MKKITKLVLIISCLFIATTGCKKFLDIVPDERPSEADAFRDPIAAKGYLYSCYGWIPNQRTTQNSIDMLTTDEVVTAFEHETFAKFPGTYDPTPWVTAGGLWQGADTGSSSWSAGRWRQGQPLRDL